MSTNGGVNWIECTTNVSTKIVLDVLAPWAQWLFGISNSQNGEHRRNWLDKNTKPNCLYGSYGTDVLPETPNLDTLEEYVIALHIYIQETGPDVEWSDIQLDQKTRPVWEYPSYRTKVFDIWTVELMVLDNEDWLKRNRRMKIRTWLDRLNLVTKNIKSRLHQPKIDVRYPIVHTTETWNQ